MKLKLILILMMLLAPSYNVYAELKAELILPKTTFKFDKDLAKKAKAESKKNGTRTPPHLEAIELNGKLRLKNTGDKAVKIKDNNSDYISIKIVLEGPGLIELKDVYGDIYDTTDDMEPGKDIIIKPGEHFDFHLPSLGYGSRWSFNHLYWTKAGTYKISTKYTYKSVSVTSLPIELNVKK